MSTLKIKENGVWKSVPYIAGPKGKDGASPNITYQVETLAAGSKATVTKSGTDESPILKFGIPIGANGSTPSLDNYIPKTGSRGNISNYISSNIVSGLTVNQSTPEKSQVTGGTITVEPGSANTSWTKLISITNSGVSISLGDNWIWSKGEVPTVSANCILICHWCNDLGIAYVVEGGVVLKECEGTLQVDVLESQPSYIVRDGVTIYTFTKGSTSYTCKLRIGDTFYNADMKTGNGYVYVKSSQGITIENDKVTAIEPGFTATINLLFVVARPI